MAPREEAAFTIEYLHVGSLGDNVLNDLPNEPSLKAIFFSFILKNHVWERRGEV